MGQRELNELVRADFHFRQRFDGATHGIDGRPAIINLLGFVFGSAEVEIAVAGKRRLAGVTRYLIGFFRFGAMFINNFFGPTFSNLLAALNALDDLSASFIRNVLSAQIFEHAKAGCQFGVDAVELISHANERASMAFGNANLVFKPLIPSCSESAIAFFKAIANRLQFLAKFNRVFGPRLHQFEDASLLSRQKIRQNISGLRSNNGHGLSASIEFSRPSGPTPYSHFQLTKGVG